MGKNLFAFQKWSCIWYDRLYAITLQRVQLIKLWLNWSFMNVNGEKKKRLLSNIVTHFGRDMGSFKKTYQRWRTAKKGKEICVAARTFQYSWIKWYVNYFHAFTHIHDLDDTFHLYTAQLIWAIENLRTKKVIKSLWQNFMRWTLTLSLSCLTNKIAETSFHFHI